MSDYRPSIPAYTHDTPVFTFEDAVESLLDAFKGNRHNYEVRVARRSVIDAYRELPNRARWPYYRRRGRITTIAAQTTGTIEYDHTGGSSERLVTLTGATFPTDAALYGLLISDRQYKIEKYLGTTTVMLTEDANPGADVTAGTSYTLFKAAYQLPTNFRRGSSLLELDGSWWPRYVSPTEALLQQVSSSQPQEPWTYTIRSTGEHYGGLVVEFSPPPLTARVYDYIYEAAPRPLFYERYSAGTVSVSSTTVTGVGTAFDAKMVGSVIRFPDNSENKIPPTGIAGRIHESDVFNPYVAERVITAVGSTTSVTIDATVSGTVSASKYTISDPVDVPDPLLTAFKRMCETCYAGYTGRESLPGYISRERRAIREALENSQHFSADSYAGSPYSDYAITVTTDA